MSTDLVRADLLASLEDSGWISSTALAIDRELPLEKYTALGALLGKVGTAVKFWVGDFLVYGEKVYGEEAAQASEALNLSEDGRAECFRVSLAISPACRRPGLSWWHHRQVSAKWISPQQRDELLDRAEREKLTTRELEAIVRDLRALGSDSRGATESSCDDVADEAARSLREKLGACGYDKAVVVEVRVRDRGAEYVITVGES